MASQQPEHSEADEVPVDALSCRLGLKCFPTRIATSMAATAYVSSSAGQGMPGTLPFAILAAVAASDRHVAE